MLQQKKSTAELIVEKETLHEQQSNALAAKQAKYNQLVAIVQDVTDELNVLRDSVVNLAASLLSLHSELLQPPPAPSQPAPLNVQMPPGAHVDFVDPSATP